MKKYERKGFVIKAKETFYIPEYQVVTCGDGCCAYRDYEHFRIEKGTIYEITANRNTSDRDLDGFMFETECLQVLDIPDGYKLVSTLAKSAKPYLGRWYIPTTGHKILIPVSNK